MSDADDREKVPEVEVVCPACYGKDQSPSYPCRYCAGTGHVSTELGRKILAMVCRYLGQMLLDDTEWL
jgi:DnaJ-class molecular chaperone